jgi:ParB/RepB/Spo0J family partition protein
MTAQRTTIQPERTHALLGLSNIRVPAERLRALSSDDSIKELAASIERNGLLQPIGVQRLNGAEHYRLIWGCNRYRAFSYLAEAAGADPVWSQIPATVYPPEMPASWLAVLEIEENLRRIELTPDEKAEHTLRLAAVLKELAPEFKSLSGTEFEPATGRGHKGMVQMVADVKGG